jgi:hypothetical protein
MSDAVKYELNESVATITLDDGKVNVLGPAMQSALNEARDKAEKDSAKAVVTPQPAGVQRRLRPDGVPVGRREGRAGECWRAASNCRCDA